MAVTITDTQAMSMARVLATVVAEYYKKHPEEEAKVQEEIRRREEAEREKVSN